MSIQTKLQTLPTSPGIYKFLDAKGSVIYVGKAKDLKNRVKNYFQKSTNHGPKNQKLVENAVDLEWIETNTEQEAIILETNFIKELRPKYNILMKDDKNFVYIKVTLNEDFPRVLIVRKMEKDGAKYFGPKTSKTDVEKTLKLLTKIFPFRDCNYEIQENHGEISVKGASRNLPCLQYHIKKCLGPCIGKIDKTEYNQIIAKIVLFLKGQTGEIEKQIKAEMQAFAINRKFEKAAKLRDNLFAIQAITQKQNISEANFDERDIFGLTQDLGKTFVTLLQIRDGKMIGQENFILEGEALEQEETSQILEAFLEQYYTSATDIPAEILLPIPLNAPLDSSFEVLRRMEGGRGVLSQGEKKSPNPLYQGGYLATFKNFLSELAGKSVKILIPQKGKKNALIALAEKNAVAYAKTNRLKWMEERTIDYEKLLAELGEKLEIEKKIKRIECYDISHLGGTDTVGSMVVFQNGKPQNSDYRHFKLRSLDEGEVDDFKAMGEVLERRLKYLVFDDKKELLAQNYKIRRGKKSDWEFIEKTAKKAKLDTENLEVKDFLVLEKIVPLDALFSAPLDVLSSAPLEGGRGVLAPQAKKNKTLNQMDISQKTNKKTIKVQVGPAIRDEPASEQSQNQIVGFVCIQNHSEKTNEIGALWIAEKENSQDFGTLLCEEIMRKSKLNKIYCHTSLDLVPFYTKLGFQEIYQIPKEIETSLIQKKLNADDYKCLAYIKSRQAQIDKSFASKPDLIVIDGGKGQLGMAEKALAEFNLRIPLISLAKKDEEIFVPEKSDPINIPNNSEISFLIQRIRDESHRFAIAFNKELRGKRMVQSKLDEIVGLGPKMKQQLLQRFGSVEGIKNAGDGEVLGIVGKGLLQKLRKDL